MVHCMIAGAVPGTPGLVSALAVVYGTTQPGRRSRGVSLRTTTL